MVALCAFLVLLVFSMEMTPLSSILTLGAPSKYTYLLFAGLAGLAVALFLQRFGLRRIILILLLLAASEFVCGILVGQQSVNAVRIGVAALSMVLLLDRPTVRASFMVQLRVFHLVIVGGFVAALLLVAAFGSDALHAPLPFSDEGIFRKVDFQGELKIRSILFYNFNLNAVPSFNIFGLNAAPTGLTSEPHAFFSFVLITSLLLRRAGMMGPGVAAASGLTLLLCMSFSNLIALAAAAAAVAWVFGFQVVLSRRISLALLIALVVGGVAFLRAGNYLSVDNVLFLTVEYDRSFAQSFAVVARFFALDFGMYPLSSIPTYYNDFQISPLSPSSFALFATFLFICLRRTYRLSRTLGATDVFLLAYIFVYATKSFGVTIFIPYVTITVLLVLFAPSAKRMPCATSQTVAVKTSWPLGTLYKQGPYTQ